MACASDNHLIMHLSSPSLLQLPILCQRWKSRIARSSYLLISPDLLFQALSRHFVLRSRNSAHALVRAELPSRQSSLELCMTSVTCSNAISFYESYHLRDLLERAILDFRKEEEHPQRCNDTAWEPDVLYAHYSLHWICSTDMVLTP